MLNSDASRLPLFQKMNQIEATRPLFGRLFLYFLTLRVVRLRRWKTKAVQGSAHGLRGDINARTRPTERRR